MSSILRRFQKYVLQVSITSRNITSIKPHKTYFHCVETDMKATNTHKKPGTADPVPHPLDRTDRAILKTLQRDASISNVALAEKVKLSALLASGALNGSSRSA